MLLDCYGFKTVIEEWLSLAQKDWAPALCGGSIVDSGKGLTSMDGSTRFMVKAESF